MQRPLITTGRLSSRLSADDKSRLQARLQPHLATPAFLKNPPQPLEVELGIGNGLALLERARANPTWHFLGCEIYLNGLRTLASHLEKEPTLVTGNRLLITDLDARDLLPQLAPASVTRLLVLFPDPWPKAKHHKRRLIQPDFLTAAARVLQPGGELWVVTDWPSYAYHTLAHLHAHKSFALNGTDHDATRCKVKPPKGEAPCLAVSELQTGKGPRLASSLRPGTTGSQPATSELELLSPTLLATPPAWWIETKYQHKAAAQNRHPWFILARRA